MKPQFALSLLVCSFFLELFNFELFNLIPILGDPI
jgi:hypothetical protein